ncbi:MAG: hypothetical protein E4G95_03215, partial [Bacteroidia bacterium]
MMRSILPKGVSVVFLSVLMLPLFGQKGIEDGSKYGHDVDSVNCRKNMSLYKTYYDQDNYQMALSFWRLAFYECPSSSNNLHLHGIKMYKSLYAETSDRTYVDSMNMVYDARIKYFGEEGKYEGQRGIDLWRLGQDGDKEFLQASYAALSKSVAIDGKGADANTMVVLMGVTQKLYDLRVMDNSQEENIIVNYGRLMDILDTRIEAVRRPGDIEAKKNIDMIFRAGGVVDCDGLISYFTPKIKESPTDVALLKKVLGLLQNTGCNDSELFYTSAENLYKIEKSSMAAYHLAEMNFNKGDNDKAEYYYNEAVTLES